MQHSGTFAFVYNFIMILGEDIMPPGRKSSSSRSSRSRSSSSRSRSRSGSSRRHSSTSHSSSSLHRSSSYRSSVSSQRARYNQPTGVPTHIKEKAISMRCRNHTYLYFNESWIDSANGTAYKQGYYDENGKYYEADSLIFKRSDGSYNAHFICEYCGNEAEFVWKEGVYPTCKSCGAQMNKETTYVDDIIQVGSYQSEQNRPSNSFSKIKKLIIIYVGAVFGVSMLSHIVGMIAMFANYTNIFDDIDNGIMNVTYEINGDTDEDYEVTNIDIYGTDIYLDEVDDKTYVICEETDDYEKHLTWDYGADSYYDYDSDCYLWFNTDVSPNLWQYWYEDIAGGEDYGWMECEGSTWYIEVSDTDWEEYTGDTFALWHIQNEFD